MPTNFNNFNSRPGDGDSNKTRGGAKRRLLDGLFGDAATTAYARWAIRWRWAIIAFSLALVATTAVGVLHLGFATNYRVFFSDDNPYLQAFEELQNVYIKDDNISFVIKPAEGDVFTPEMLTAIRGLTDEAWKLPFVTRVDSLTNFQNSFAEGDDLTVEDLVQRHAVLDSNAIARIRGVALSEPMLVNSLISPDGTTTSVYAQLTLPEERPDEVVFAMNEARALADVFRAENPDARVAITGLVALNSAFMEASMSDMATLIPIMYGVLLLVMVLLLRSLGGTLATLAVIGFSAATAMGLAGWAGVQLTPPSSVAPTVILTLAIADSIHLLVTMLKEMRTGATKRDAIVESIRINFQPVFLTSLTTVIGFMSLNFSDAPPFHDLGNMTATGVVAAWFYSIVFLPALIAVMPLRIKQRAETGRSAMERLAEFVIARRRVLIWGTAAVVIGLGAMIPRIELNDQFVQYFDESIPFRADTDFAMENLSGIYQVNWSLDAGQEGGVSDPDYLKRVEEFTVWLKAQPGVVHVSTTTDMFNRLNRNMHGDDPAWYRLPGDRELAAQYLLLYEMSLPYELDLNNRINIDKSATRLIATTENFTTNELRALEAAAEGWLAENLPSASGEATGPVIMFAYITKRNAESMFIGTALAFALISVTLILALRNFRLGLLSLVPNAVPALMAFGLWSILVGQVDVASSIVAATSLGIIVDATVHFLSKYSRARRQRGEDPEASIRYAFSTVGTALWVSSAILVAGFAVLGFSTFKLNHSMGLLTAIAIAMALLVDFLLLPALLLAVDRDKKAPSSEPNLITQPAE
jgi:predicted RND superfamily exporter protein